MNSNPIVIEHTYDAPLSAVWKAITEKNEMRQWFFEPMVDFRAEVGFETEFDVECEGEVYTHQWKVTEVSVEKKIVYDWCYRGILGESTVTWELSATPEGTRLKLTHDGGESFPQDNPVFRRESCEAGWTYFLHKSLAGFLKRDAA